MQAIDTTTHEILLQLYGSIRNKRTKKHFKIYRRLTKDLVDNNLKFSLVIL